MPHDARDPQAVAEHVRERMLASDAATRALGIHIDAIGPDAATATMVVRPDMLNGHRTCHGGIITALADSAFAFACNAGNELTVASGVSIDFVAPAYEADRLTARATGVGGSGRTGVYDVAVTNQHGASIALFRGRSYRAKGRPAVAD